MAATAPPRTSTRSRRRPALSTRRSSKTLRLRTTHSFWSLLSHQVSTITSLPGAWSVPVMSTPVSEPVSTPLSRSFARSPTAAGAGPCGQGLGDNGPGAGRVPRPREKDTELVALRIGKHDPRLLSLTNVRPAGTQLQQTVYLGRSVIRAEVRCRRFLVSLGSPTGTKTKPGSRSGAGLISNSSSASNTTTQPRAFAHHRPSSAGCAASTTTCFHSRLMGLMLLRSPHP